MAAQAADTPLPTEWKAVKNAGVTADRNARHRRFMEDAHTLIDCFGDKPHQAFFGVYDGHGGKSAALFCKDHLHKHLLTALEPFGENNVPAEKAFDLWQSVYNNTDAAMKESVPSAGACVVTALVQGYGGKRVLHVANAGDARAVLIRDRKAERLTEDHKPSNPAEAERIVAAGGFVSSDRVNGIIGVTRSMGDHTMRDFLTNKPYCTTVALTDAHTHLILACDGVWDVMSDQEAADEILAEDADCNTLSKRLLVKALKAGTTDNLSVVVVKL